MRALKRFSGLPAIALASAGMIVFAQFPPAEPATPVLRGADFTVRLVSSPTPVEAVAPPEVSTGLADTGGYGLVAAGDLQSGMDDAALGDLVAMPAAAFNPVGLLFLPLFPLALIPLLFTLGGSLLAFLMYQFSPAPGMADAVAANPVLDGAMAGAGTLLSGPTFNTVFSGVDEVSNALASGVGTDSATLAPETLADLSLTF